MIEINVPMLKKSIDNVSSNILKIYSRREAAVYALAQSYAVRALNLFRNNQATQKYWINKTFQAFNRVFSNAFAQSDGIGFFLAHGVEYGVYLELANNRANQALRPIMSGLAIKFIKDIKQIYGIK